MTNEQHLAVCLMGTLGAVILIATLGILGQIVDACKGCYVRILERLDDTRRHACEANAAADKAGSVQESCLQLLEALALDAGVLMRPNVLAQIARSRPQTPGLDGLADEGHSLVSSEWEVME